MTSFVGFGLALVVAAQIGPVSRMIVDSLTASHVGWYDAHVVPVFVTTPYGEPASPKGVPSQSRQITQRSPGWTISPPSARTRSTAAARSATGK